MIARIWKGWTLPGNADSYENFLNEIVFPGLRKIKGYRGGSVFRKDTNEESEFIITNYFDNLNSVKIFAGNNYEIPVFEPEARVLLSKVEPLVKHYEVRKVPLFD